MKSKMLFLLMIFLSLGAMAQTTQSNPLALDEGTYYGKIDSVQFSARRPVKLFLQNYPNRPGSFLAILTKEDKIGFAYIVDKFQTNRYGMIPIFPLNNGQIGVTNYNPSLSLTINWDNNRPIIKILPNESDNKAGFAEAMKFKFVDRSHDIKLENSIPGTYRFGNSRSNTVNIQDQNRESAVSLSTSEIKGDFTLREVRPSLHLLLASSMKGVGMDVSDSSSYMAFFIRDYCLVNTDYLVIMKSSGELTFLKEN